MKSPPIILLGAPRSGTTLLGRIFSRHPEVAYLLEPRLIWSIGNHDRLDEVLTAEHLTPAIARRIDRRFDRFRERLDRPRFAEKTPSNLLRIPFIRALYPEAKFIFIERDPVASLHSLARLEQQPPDPDRLWARLCELRPENFHCQLRRLLDPEERAFFGPRVPGWRALLKLERPVRLARQHRLLMRHAERDLPSVEFHRLSYEALVADPERVIRGMFHFAQLSVCPIEQFPEILPEGETPEQREIDPAFREIVEMELAAS